MPNKFKKGDMVLPKGYRAMGISKHDAVIVSHTRKNSKGVNMVHFLNGFDYDSAPQDDLVFIRSIYT